MTGNHTNDDDAGLLKLIAAGSESAFAELVDRHAKYLYGVARSLVSNAADADDIVQETFIAVLDARFRGEAAVRTWLVRTLINRAAMLRRSQSRRQQRTDEMIARGEPLKADAAAASDAKMDLPAMLESLSPEHREVIVLRELEGMSYAEMAKLLHVPRGTIESRLFRARDELRKRFGPTV